MAKKSIKIGKNDIGFMYSDFFSYKKNSKIVFFDNSSMTQKPMTVIQTVNNYLSGPVFNYNRSYCNEAENFNKTIEEIRVKIVKFINCDYDEVFFVHSATDGIEKLARLLENSYYSREILYTSYDHKSFINPFLENDKFLLKEYQIFEHSGDADWRDILKKVNNNTKVILINHLNSVFGLLSEPENIKINLKDQEIFIFLDASQSISRVKLDVKKLGIDAMVFSGSKMFALEGVGVLYLNKDYQKKFKINRDFFEKGTLPLTAIISLGKAIDFLNELNLDNVRSYLINLTQYLLSKLKKYKEIEFLPGPAYVKCASGYGILSFKFKKIRSDEIAMILSNFNICVRTNMSCFGFDKDDFFSDSIRISLHINNTKEEIDYFISVLDKILT